MQAAPRGRAKVSLISPLLAMIRGRYAWEEQGPLPLGVSTEEHTWLAGRYGAPYVWRDPSGCFRMVLMGEYEVATHRSAVGLLSSADGEQWELLPEKRAYEMNSIS